MKSLLLKPAYFILTVVLTVALLYLAAFSFFSASPVVLWTDALVFVLLLSILAFALSAYNKPHLRESWRRVFCHKLGVAALVILIFYAITGVVDSIHFRLVLNESDSSNGELTRLSNDTLSVLDLMLTPLRSHDEKTYSAPFATHSFAKENVEISPGVTRRVFQRLEYGGRHLQDVDGKWLDVFVKGLYGLAIGLLLFGLIVFPLIFLLAKAQASRFMDIARRMLDGTSSEIPWRVILGVVATILVVVGMIIAWAPYYHIMGTDKVGQDVLYQAIKSVRTGLVIGTLTTLVMLPFAVLLGIMAGYFKGWIDDVIQYLYTTLSSIPGVLLIAASILTIQVYMSNHPEMFQTDAERADMRLFFLCLILGITSWTGLCRMLRGEAMKLRESDYVSAALALGVRPFSLLRRHIQPNVMHIVLIAVVLDFSGLVLAEAVLSYVGVGVDPSMHSWGNMINSARLEMSRDPIVWWSLLAAFVFMFILVLAANLFSDAVRDAFDPRLRKQ